MKHIPIIGEPTNRSIYLEIEQRVSIIPKPKLKPKFKSQITSYTPEYNQNEEVYIYNQINPQ